MFHVLNTIFSSHKTSKRVKYVGILLKVEFCFPFIKLILLKESSIRNKALSRKLISFSNNSALQEVQTSHHFHYVFYNKWPTIIKFNAHELFLRYVETQLFFLLQNLFVDFILEVRWALKHLFKSISIELKTFILLICFFLLFWDLDSLGPLGGVITCCLWKIAGVSRFLCAWRLWPSTQMGNLHLLVFIVWSWNGKLTLSSKVVIVYSLCHLF